MWIKIILVAEIFFTVGQVRSDMQIHLSRACHATGNCMFHILDKCSENHKIAIVDAYFTGNNECDSQRCPANFSSIPENTTRTVLGDDQLIRVNKACTSMQRCRIQAEQGPHPPYNKFSVLKYQCIDDRNEITCNGESKIGCDISLSVSMKPSCTCIIRRDKAVALGLLDFYLLGMVQQKSPCTTLEIYIDGKKRHYDCNTPLTPYRYLANGTHQMNENTSIIIQRSTSVWILIKGSEPIMVTCNSKDITSQAPGKSLQNVSETCPSYITTPLPGQSTGNGSGANSGANTGAVAGGVTVAVLVILVVVLALLWFRYKRNQKPKPKHSIEKTSDEKYSVATRVPIDNYHEIEAMKPKQPTSNYDYATVTHEVKSAGKEGQSSVEEDYAQIGDKQTKVTGHNNTTLLTAKSYKNKSFSQNEDDYNHLAADDKTTTVENGAHSGGYDTAASASKSVQQMMNKEVPTVDSDSDYNHIDNNPKPKPLQGDYDTTASASKAVAKMMETNEQIGDNYDHFRQTKAGSQAADSPYDTAEHHAKHSGDYSIAGVLQKNDPYDLAK